MNRTLKSISHSLPLGSLWLMIAIVIASPIMAHADDHKKGSEKSHKKMSEQKHKKNKARMTLCHYELDGDYSEKSLPIHAAMRHLANHELDKEPVVGTDGAESCVAVQPPATTCKVDVNGTDTTVSEFLANGNITVSRYNSDTDSCELYEGDNPRITLYNNDDELGLDIFFDSHKLDITSQQQYDDCAYDIETAAQAAELTVTVNCPEISNFPDGFQ